MRSYCFFAPLTPCRSLFLSTRKDRLSKSNRPTLVFSFFLFEKFIVETAGAFFGSTGFVVYSFFSPSLLEPVAPCTLTLFECLQPEVWKFSESATLLVFLGPRVEDVLPGWDQQKFPEVVLVTNSEVSRSQCPELGGVENGCISKYCFPFI